VLADIDGNLTARAKSTNGSWWMLQILSTKTSCNFLNPTNHSWWIVQILSTNGIVLRFLESHQPQLVDISDPFYKGNRAATS